MPILKPISILNPILDGGGPLWPGWPWTASLFPQGKSYDHQNSWLCICLCLNSPRKVIFGTCSWNFWKLKKTFLTVMTSKGPPFGKKSKILEKKIILEKSNIFSFWICILHVLSFLLSYRSCATAGRGFYPKNDFLLSMYGLYSRAAKIQKIFLSFKLPNWASNFLSAQYAAKQLNAKLPLIN